MMRSSAAGFIICQIIVQAESLGAYDTLRGRHNDTLDASESRYHYKDYEYTDYGRKEDLPVTFQAPSYEAHDYWRYKSDHDNRRTFFEDDKGSGFYKFMTSIFTGRNDAKNGFRYNPPTPPYPFEAPFGFRPTEPNYIPPPKPIRASVIKLETITRSPNYPSFEYKTTPKYYPDVGTILNHVLIENSKTQRFGHNIPEFKPLPVLPKPVYIPPTTLKPFHLKVANQTPPSVHNIKDYKYPESVQDQLPHFDLQDVRIPYESEQPIPQIFNTLPTQPPTGGIRFPVDDSEVTTNAFGINIRSLNFDTTTLKSFPGVVEKIKRPFNPKKGGQPDKSSVEMIANLTAEGLSTLDKENANIHKYVNHFNMRNLISYEMSKHNNISQTDNSSSSLINFNDELSLDARILKDTNWDGLAPLTTTETTPVVYQKEQTKGFWEIDDDKTTLAETTKQPTTEIYLQTTSTEFTPTETTELFTTEETSTLTTPEIQPRSDTPYPETTTTVERATPRRRYSRRPKILNFTPYPTTNEPQKKTINRNNFPKRQKPNITITFGNKNILRKREGDGGDEVMKFSDEDKRRRKIGKRRHGYRRKRISTSEPSIPEGGETSI